MIRVNILGEALDGLGRWYVAVPPFLIVGFLVALFFLTGAGQARLQAAGEQLLSSAYREQAIEALDGAVNKAQNALRGFLLTEDTDYLKPYRAAVADLEPRLDRLRRAYENSSLDSADLHALQGLVGKKQGELGVTLALHDGPAPSRALAFVKSRVGQKTSSDIEAVVDRMRSEEARAHEAAESQWKSSLRLSRWITVAGIMFNMLLVAIAARLVYMDLKRRTAQTADLLDQKAQLEQQVEDRTRELVELSTHLQSLSEREKASLARELHDELGGLLVGARMDVSWAEQHLDANDSDLKHRLNRVQQNLAAGVDLKRRIIEELRPTLLDNVGLFAALKWQFKETCGAAGLKCIEYFPDENPAFTSEAAIALFRIAQEAFTNILKHAAATSVDLALDIDEDMVLMRIADDGVGIPAGRFTAIGSHGLASMRHRVRALDGQLSVSNPPSGGTLLVVRIPVAKALRPPLETETP